jgi:uncharacterized protein
MENPAIKSGWLRVLAYILSLILIMILFGIFAIAILSVISGDLSWQFRFPGTSVFLIAIYQLILMSGITALTMGFRKYIDGKDYITLGFYRSGMNKDLALGLITGFAVISIGFIILVLSDRLAIQEIRPDYSFLAGSLVLCLIISWTEELSFRGYILNNLMESFHPCYALFFSSVLFAAFHSLNPGMAVVPFINLMLAGVLLGIVFIYTKTLWYALSLHFSWNFFQGPVFGFPVSGIEMSGLFRQDPAGEGILTGGNFGFEGSLLCSLLIILCIFAFNQYHKKAS